MIRKIYLFVLTVSILSIVSCSEEFLETTPTDAISDVKALSSPDNMLLILNGLHRQMHSQGKIPGSTSRRAGQSYYMPSFDAMGGMIIHTSRSNGWMRDDLQWLEHTDATTLSVKNFWYHRYHYIASTNAIINKVASDDLLIDSEMSNILGQSHAYRAWAYHQLVMTYAKGYLIGTPATDPGVPLMFRTEAPYTGEARSTVAEIYAEIEKDLNLAISYFENATAPKNNSHLSINTTYGIQARVALSKGDWALATSAAVKARDGYALLDESGWKSGFNDYNLSEVIWGSQVIDSETNYYRSFFYYVSPTFNGSHNRSNPKIINQEVWNNIPTTDYRKDAWLALAPNTNSAASNDQGGGFESDPNYDNEDDFNAAKKEILSTYGMTSRHNTHPYMNVKFLQKNPGTISPDDVIYMRSSEMILIEAEAKAMLNDIGGSQDALAILGEQRDSAFDKTAFTNQASLMEQIKFQRHVELWGEGFSFHDYIRWDDAIDQTNSGAAKVLYGNGFSQDKPSVNNKWIWKIPQAEIDANPNISESNQNK